MTSWKVSTMTQLLPNLNQLTLLLQLIYLINRHTKVKILPTISSSQKSSSGSIGHSIPNCIIIITNHYHHTRHKTHSKSHVDPFNNNSSGTSSPTKHSVSVSEKTTPTSTDNCTHLTKQMVGFNTTHTPHNIGPKKARSGGAFGSQQSNEGSSCLCSSTCCRWFLEEEGMLLVGLGVIFVSEKGWTVGF